MIPESVIAVLPLPPRILSPNVHQATIRGRFAKAAATKRQRRLAKEAVLEECIETAPWKKCEVAAEFFYQQKRRHDDENAMVSIKPAYDGIVDAGLVADDDSIHMRKLPPAFSVDRENPRVELTIKRVK